MTRQEFDALARHKIGAPKPNSEVAASLYRHTPPLEPKDWPYRSTMRRMSGDALAPRTPEPDDCPRCEGHGWIEQVKNERTGSRNFTACRACRGTGRRQ